MASVQWTLAFGLLVTLLVLNFILLVNIYTPFRKALILALRKLFSNPYVKTTLVLVAVALLLLTYDAYSHQQRFSEELSQDLIIDNAMAISLRAKIAYNQRNLYISGFSLYLMIIMYFIIRVYEEHDAETETNRARLQVETDQSSKQNPNSAVSKKVN